MIIVAWDMWAALSCVSGSQLLWYCSRDHEGQLRHCNFGLGKTKKWYSGTGLWKELLTDLTKHRAVDLAIFVQTLKGWCAVSETKQLGSCGKKLQPVQHYQQLAAFATWDTISCDQWQRSEKKEQSRGGGVQLSSLESRDKSCSIWFLSLLSMLRWLQSERKAPVSVPVQLSATRETWTLTQAYFHFEF